MSRDWRPFEQHAADLWHMKQYHSFLHDAELKWVLPGGKEEDASCKRFDTYDRYPNLSFLWSAGKVKELSKNYAESLDAAEKELAAVIVSDDNKTEYNKTTPIAKWYLGQLDKCFYYSEENNRLLEAYIKGENMNEDR